MIGQHTAFRPLVEVPGENNREHMTKETFYLLARKPQKEGMEGPTIPFDDQ
jgi:hypothetical protein